jgi:DNA-binding Lrp family transcriptional regulator
MSKSSSKQLEEDQRKVIQQLLENGRQSALEIANKVGFSRQKVWKIIKNLEKEKIIWGYTSVIDENHYNESTYFGLIKAKGDFSDKIDQILESIKLNTPSKFNANLYGSYYLNGPYDWIIIFSAKDIRDAMRYSAYIKKNYGDYIERIEIMECVFPLMKFGKINPNIKELKEFQIV